MNGRHRTAAVLACVGVAVLLPACGHRKVRVEPTIALTPTTAPPKAGTLADWTTFVRANTVDAATTWKTIAHCPVTPAYYDLVCSVGWYTYGGQVEQFGTSLRAAQDPTSTTFLGTPPESIKALVDRTAAAVNAIDDADHARIEVCTSGKPASAACTSAAQAWDTARVQFQNSLAAWKPYA